MNCQNLILTTLLFGFCEINKDIFNILRAGLKHPSNLLITPKINKNSWLTLSKRPDVEQASVFFCKCWKAELYKWRHTLYINEVYISISLYLTFSSVLWKVTCYFQVSIWISNEEKLLWRLFMLYSFILNIIFLNIFKYFLRNKC